MEKPQPVKQPTVIGDDPETSNIRDQSALAVAHPWDAVAKEKSEDFVAMAVPVVHYRARPVSSAIESEIKRTDGGAQTSSTTLNLIFGVGAIAAGLFVAGGIFQFTRDFYRRPDADMPTDAAMNEIQVSAAAPTVAHDSGADLVQGLHKLLCDKWAVDKRTVSEPLMHTQPELVEA
jgi:hypothetical protein